MYFCQWGFCLTYVYLCSSCGVDGVPVPKECVIDGPMMVMSEQCSCQAVGDRLQCSALKSHSWFGCDSISFGVDAAEAACDASDADPAADAADARIMRRRRRD